MRRRLNATWAVLALLVGAVAARASDDLDSEPIRYSSAAEDNPASHLQRRLKDGSATLTYEKYFGYLRSLLNELRVPASSQMLVFSKTSMQQHRIGPATPRAIYFGDDVYVGYCKGGGMLEVS